LIISIITINYNNIKGLILTIESVLQQTYSKVEYIIIDGGSTDGSKEYIESQTEHINYWVSEPDSGVYHAMNKGLKKSTGDFCLFLNSGDYFSNEHVLSNLYNQLDKKYGMIYGLIEWEHTGRYWNPKRDLKSFEFVFNSLIPHQASFYRVDALRKIGGYKEKYRVISDWTSMIDLLNAGYKMKKVDLLISKCETQGISANLVKLVKKEKLHYLMLYSPLTLIRALLFKIKKLLR
jgi:glycosyltransferase involved in cell wall biosynthesis